MIRLTVFIICMLIASLISYYNHAHAIWYFFDFILALLITFIDKCGGNTIGDFLGDIDIS